MSDIQKHKFIFFCVCTDFLCRPMKFKWELHTYMLFIATETISPCSIS